MWPFCTIQSMATCISTGIGLCCGWLNSSMMRLPRSILRLRRRIEVRAELRERGQLAELRQVALQPSGHLLHRFQLRRRPDADTEMPTEIAGRMP